MAMLRMTDVKISSQIYMFIIDVRYYIHQHHYTNQVPTNAVPIMLCLIVRETENRMNRREQYLYQVIILSSNTHYFNE